jgi:uncharacterized phage infection (PIP) family protein YhgE
MTKPGDSQTKKTLSESQKAQAELEPIEGEEQDNPTLWEIATTHKVSYADAVPIQEDMRLKRDALKAACTMAEMRKDRTPLANMKKRAQEAEGELSIMKGIETNRVKEAQARSNQLQDELDRVKRENNDLYNKIADLTESLKSKDYFNAPDYKFLIDENKNLHTENQVLTEKEKKAKKVRHLLEDWHMRLHEIRKAGM